MTAIFHQINVTFNAFRLLVEGCPMVAAGSQGQIGVKMDFDPVNLNLTNGELEMNLNPTPSE